MILEKLPRRHYPRTVSPQYSILQANFHTFSQSNVCVFHVHRIFVLPARGTATCIPLNSFPPLLGFLYTHQNTSVH